MKEYLTEYKKELSMLNKEEIIMRDIYLKELLDGKLLGPLTNVPSIDKPWLSKYEINSIKAELPKETIYNYFIKNTKEYDNLIAINYYGTKITYGELKKNIEEISKKLIKMGIKKGDIVTIALPTCPLTTYLFYAINKIGAVSNFIHPLSNPNEFENLINEVNSKIVFAYDGCVKNIVPILNNTNVEKLVSYSPFTDMPLVIKTLMNFKIKTNVEYSDKVISYNDFMKIKTNYVTSYTEEYKKDTLAVMTHTSGTTGVPKGAMHTNDGFNSMVLQYKVVAKNFNVGDTMLTVLPPLASFMLCNCMHMPLCLGVTVDMVCKYDKEDIHKYFLKNKTGSFHMMGIPSYFTEILDNKKLKNTDFSRLGYIVVGGEKLEKEKEELINECFKSHNAKVKITKGYGETEIVSSATYTFENANKLGSVGIPLLKTSVKIVDLDTNEELSYNKEGEIYFNSPSLMKAYYNNIEETKENIVTFGNERWIKTGDLGYIDNEGNVFVTGRIKRMFLTVGSDKSLTKAFPDRIENTLSFSKYVEKCLVVGKPDKERNKVPKAFIVLKSGFNYSDEVLSDLVSICNSKLRETLRPTEYVFIEKMPVTKMGKININKVENEEDINVLVRKKIN